MDSYANSENEEADQQEEESVGSEHSESNVCDLEDQSHIRQCQLELMPVLLFPPREADRKSSGP